MWEAAIGPVPPIEHWLTWAWFPPMRPHHHTIYISYRFGHKSSKCNIMLPWNMARLTPPHTFQRSPLSSHLTRSTALDQTHSTEFTPSNSLILSNSSNPTNSLYQTSPDSLRPAHSLQLTTTNSTQSHLHSLAHVPLAIRFAKSLYWFYLLQLLTRIFDVLCFFQALAEALKTNSSVRDMNLAFNEIGAEGAQAWPVSDVLGSLA